MSQNTNNELSYHLPQTHIYRPNERNGMKATTASNAITVKRSSRRVA